MNHKKELLRSLWVITLMAELQHFGSRNLPGAHLGKACSAKQVSYKPAGQ